MRNLRIVSTVTWPAEHNPLNDFSANIQLIIDLNLDRSEADGNAAIWTCAFRFNKPNPSMRNRNRQLAFFLLSQCGPCFAFDFLMTLEVNGRLADR